VSSFFGKISITKNKSCNSKKTPLFLGFSMLFPAISLSFSMTTIALIATKTSSPSLALKTNDFALLSALRNSGSA